MTTTAATTSYKGGFNMTGYNDKYKSFNTKDLEIVFDFFSAFEYECDNGFDFEYPPDFFPAIHHLGAEIANALYVRKDSQYYCLANCMVLHNLG